MTRFVTCLLPLPAYDRLRCELQARNWCATTCLPTVGTTESREDDLLLVPQPAGDWVRVLTDRTLETGILYDARGKALRRLEGSILAVADLAPGIYFLRLNWGEGGSSGKKVLVGRP